MNSYGGDVIAASQMRAMLQDYPGRVTVRIDGIAASAATVVATAGDVVKIQDTAYYMIHDPLAVFFLAMFNLEDLGRLLNELKTVKDGIVNAYEKKTGLSRSRLATMMTHETWMSAQEAVDLGFADQVVSESKKKTGLPARATAQATAMVNCLRNYVNVPAALLAQSQPVNVNPARPGTSPALAEETKQAAERLRTEVKILKKE
jgi:ClpP class serine protease